MLPTLHRWLLVLLLASATTSSAAAQPEPGEIRRAVQDGVELILSMQEGDDKAEWPYEGVYRVGRDRRIPIGYRVGGTSIAGGSVVLAPGYDDSEARQDAIARATRFVLDARGHSLMDPETRGDRYDVRGWGYTYALRYLLLLESRSAAPKGMVDEVSGGIEWYIDAIESTENRNGGWNYASVGRVSPFMTGPTLQALFEARQRGYDVDKAVVTRALDALEAARATYGSYVYAGEANDDRADAVAGAAGRMMVSETTLLLAGRSSQERVRSAIDAFIVHWEWFDKRRAQNGTHVAPYGIAPYYFYYAHFYAAQAAEQLPSNEREEYRRRLNGLLFQNRLADGAGEGGWNDRVFDRSANYGTSMAIMALMAPDMPAPARWDNSDPDDR